MLGSEERREQMRKREGREREKITEIMRRREKFQKKMRLKYYYYFYNTATVQF